HLLMERRTGERAHFVAVNIELSLGRQIILGRQIYDRALAAARVAHQCNRLARLGDEADIVEDGAVRRVAEGDGAEIDAHAGAGAGAGVRSLGFGVWSRRRGVSGSEFGIWS